VPTNRRIAEEKRAKEEREHKAVSFAPNFVFFILSSLGNE